MVRAERRRVRTPLEVSSVGFDASAGRGLAVSPSARFDPASIETVLFDDVTPGLRLLTLELTLVTAVASSFRGAVWWPTPPIPGLPLGIVRAVQVADVAGVCSGGGQPEVRGRGVSVTWQRTPRCKPGNAIFAIRDARAIHPRLGSESNISSR
ncbi:hypothetical protein [Corynebacterium parakroppenstedtii]|uniref:Uncharacterized protein n=2 Tax=Corynebacterium TaxID=1716 RepID=A0ABS9HIN4_9CORY|nr:hypothetical protein [Corynebacterium parakroppenstedtii]MCF6772928.1 hypothetical protein [Corynebacterium parakroppenstedtii]